MAMPPAEKQFETHLFTYRHDGGEWILEIKATDADDARARIGRLAYATYNGVAVARLPALLGPVGICAAGLRNALFALMPRFWAQR